MNKPLLVLSCPISTRSGYGDHSRDLFHAIDALDQFDIKIISQRWGNTPMNDLSINNPKDKKIVDCLLMKPLETQPDVYIQITVPNEYNPIGKFNIGITAGIETTTAPIDWIHGCNKMDLIIVPSKHSKDVLTMSEYAEKNQQGQVVNMHKIETPIEVLFEGYGDVYNPANGLRDMTEIEPILNNIPEKFNFLFVGHWLEGKVGQDRKDVGMLVKTFLTIFKNKKDKPGLILKTSTAGFSVIDRERMLDKLRSLKKDVGGDLPNVYLLHGQLTEEEMAVLYNHNKVKVHISFTKGEGFGRPLLEASLSNKPIIASNWSGQIDFLQNGAILLDGKLKNVHETAANKFILKESQWFSVNYSNAANILEAIFENYDKYLPDAKRLTKYNKEHFSLRKMNEQLKVIFDDKVKIQEEVKINLPILKKIGDVKSPDDNKIIIPQLKKEKVR